MVPGVFAKTFAGSDPLTVLRACRAAGFSAVQYNMACSGLGSLPEMIDAGVAEAVSAAAKDCGIAVCAVSATYNMIDPSPERREAGRRSFAAIAGAARRMGSTLVTVCSGSANPLDQWAHHPHNATPEAWAEMCREFEILLQMADDHGVLIGVEPEQANVVSSAKKARALLDAFPGSAIRIVFDPANLIEHLAPPDVRGALDEALDLLGPALALVHAKDRAADGRVAVAGEGVVDWPHLIRGLKARGYDGALVAHGMSAAEAPRAAAYLAAVLERL